MNLRRRLHRIATTKVSPAATEALKRETTICSSTSLAALIPPCFSFLASATANESYLFPSHSSRPSFILQRFFLSFVPFFRLLHQQIKSGRERCFKAEGSGRPFVACFNFVTSLYTRRIPARIRSRSSRRDVCEATYYNFPFNSSENFHYAHPRRLSTGWMWSTQAAFSRKARECACRSKMRVLEATRVCERKVAGGVDGEWISAPQGCFGYWLLLFMAFCGTIWRMSFHFQDVFLILIPRPLLRFLSYVLWASLFSLRPTSTKRLLCQLRK